MEKSNALALVVAYYLSRYDRRAYASLGYATMKAAHDDIGRILAVNPNSVKNMRDEFDPVHGNNRAGWYQRPMLPSRRKVLAAFEGMPEEELRGLVLGILREPDFPSESGLRDAVAPMLAQDEALHGLEEANTYVPRGLTGIRSEELFLEFHKSTGLPCSGRIIDKRLDGCGYDFEIIDEKVGGALIEVKGVDSRKGGISFTNKEWETAKDKRTSYFLALVLEVSSKPIVHLIQDPVGKLVPKQYVFMAAQLQWNVGWKELSPFVITH